MVIYSCEKLNKNNNKEEIKNNILKKSILINIS